MRALFGHACSGRYAGAGSLLAAHSSEEDFEGLQALTQSGGVAMDNKDLKPQALRCL